MNPNRAKLKDAVLDSCVWHRRTTLKGKPQRDSEVGGRESMSDAYKHLSWGRKDYGGGRVYKVMRRILASSVGQSWTQVKAHLEALLGPWSAHGGAAANCYVYENCMRTDAGMVANTEFGVMPLYNGQYYVGNDGRLAVYTEKLVPAKPAPITRVVISDKLQLQKVGETWFECKLDTKPQDIAVDVLLNLTTGYVYDMRNTYGRDDVYCVAKKSASAKVLRQYGL